MDHAINDLQERLNATIDIWEDVIPKNQLEPEIKAYVEAMNVLEQYYYGEKKTILANVMARV